MPTPRAGGSSSTGSPAPWPRPRRSTQFLAPVQIDLVIDLDADTEAVLKRLASRRVCNDCGAIYSTGRPPRVERTCDICGGDVIQREDDTESAIRRRLELYGRETAPLIAWYAEQGRLVQVDGMGSPDAVTARLIKVIEERRLRGLEDAVPPSVQPQRP